MSGVLAGVGAEIGVLVEQIRQRGGSFVGKPDLFAWEASLVRAHRPYISVAQWQAGMLLEQTRLATLEIPQGWTLAGEHLPGGTPMNRYPKEQLETAQNDDRFREGEYAQAKKLWEYAPRVRARPYYSGVGEVDVEKLQGGVPGWGGNRGYTGKPEAYWGLGWIDNHSIRDYALLVRLGYAGLREKVRAELARFDICDPEYPARQNFLSAADKICEAGITLGRRYAQVAAELAAQTDDPDERQRLKTMADTCARVPEHGAQTFHEAVQALWLGHIVTCGEDGINANSFGRIDQILHPYYERDLAAGRITRDEALHLMAEFACKLYLDYDVQTITLGGQDSAGRDAVNEMSYLILEATEQVGFIRSLNIRLHRASPAAFVNKAAHLILRGGGIPYIFNDDAFIPALTARGIAVEHARDYAPIGCVELTIPGKANPHAVSGWLNVLKCLELALYGGIDPETGEQVGPATPGLAQTPTFEAFYQSYLAQVEALAKRMVYACNAGELRQREGGALPGWSLLTDDCVARGRDITDGGALYNYHSICLLGAPDTADALCALKKLVFEQRKIAPAELLAALRTDFDGAESVRRMLLTEAPKYGNDHAEVDTLAGEVCSDFIALMDRMRSPLGGRYFVHLFSFLCNISFGAMTGATPDGRKKGEPLAYSLSAHQGRDVRGVTALLNSLARIPHQDAAGGSAAIIDLSPALFREGGEERLAALIRGGLAQGVGQLQFNVTSGEQMKRAQEDPEHYGNLAVRVAGYSQMFKLLSKPLQDHVIARTKHEG